MTQPYLPQMFLDMSRHLIKMCNLAGHSSGVEVTLHIDIKLLYLEGKKREKHQAICGGGMQGHCHCLIFIKKCMCMMTKHFNLGLISPEDIVPEQVCSDALMQTQVML